MNPIGMHYGYWTQYWGSEPLQFVKRAKKCGFDILEVNAPKVARMSDAERDVLKGAITDAGLSLTYSIGMTADEDKQILTDRAIEGVREAIKAAEDNDVIFCVEVVNRFEQFIMNTAAEGIAFAERVGSPNCKILLDTFHMNIEEDSLGGSILEAGNWLGHFHLGETNRRHPGRGRIPWPEIFGALRQINYQGAVVMEPFLLPGGEVGRDISVYRDLLGSADLDEEAARSVQFVRSEQEKLSGQAA
jgi:D-psicose/D-tagatose/L-ribulose 3-epimerase